MKKRIIAIVAIIALVAILGIVFVACNADSYVSRLEKAGYVAYAMEEDEINDMVGEDAPIEWAVFGMKISLTGGSEMVYVFKLANADDAQALKAELEEEGLVEVSGKIVIVGTSEQAIKDAK